jgi:uncharacterized protein
VFRPIWIVLYCMVLASCGGSSVRVGSHTFAVEIAADDASREKGLMFRDHLDADKGMVFIFDDEAQRSFWMKNCKISLDILYFDSALKMVGAALNTPPCQFGGDSCPAYPSGAPAKYVLEIQGGLASKLGIKLGDKMALNLHADDHAAKQ